MQKTTWEEKELNDFLFYGSAYYPEAVKPNAINQDIALMKKANMNVVRLAEFSWSVLEPAEGEYCFEWLDNAIDIFWHNGISVILCTPSATPPVWLTKKYPKMLKLKSDLKPMTHGWRRHCCSNNELYIDYSNKIAEKLALHYNQNKAVIGWQIDNEIYVLDDGCYCEVCVQKFRTYLKDKYKTIGFFNEKLNMNLWSETYYSFDQIDAPRPDIFSHPSLITEWHNFQSFSNAQFIHSQKNFLKASGIVKPIGTDMMPFMGQSHIEMNEKLDIVQINYYRTKNNLWTLNYWLNFCYNLKDKPFWTTETSANGAGSKTSTGNVPKGFCTANAWLSYFNGATCLMYWLFRNHFAGHEVMHGSVINACGTPLYTFDEVCKIGSDLKIAGEYLINSKIIRSNIAMQFSFNSFAITQGQAIIDETIGFTAYSDLLESKFFKPLLECGLRPDVLLSCHSPNDYKVIITPFMLSFNEEGFLDKMIKWIIAGGTWIVGPLSDIRDIDGTKSTQNYMCNIEKLLNIKCEISCPATPETIELKYLKDGSISKANLWCDAYSFNDNESVSLGDYISYPANNLSCFVQKRVGNGSVIVLGTLPEQEVFEKIIADISLPCGIENFLKTSKNISVVKREYKGKTLLCIVESENYEGSLTLDKKHRNILTNEILEGKIKINPYETLILLESR